MIPIILSAGHGAGDPGAVFKKYKEADQTAFLVKQISKILKENNLKVETVPNNLGLQDTINWLNTHYPTLDSAWAIEIHRDSFLPAVSDADNRLGVYHYAQDIKSKAIGDTIQQSFIRNGGSKNSWNRPHNSRGFNLGFLQHTKCWTHLLELGFMQGRNDDEHLTWLAEVASQAIMEAYRSHFQVIELPVIDDFGPADIDWKAENDKKILQIEDLANKIENLKNENQKLADASKEKDKLINKIDDINEKILESKQNSSEKKFWQSKKFIVFALSVCSWLGSQILIHAYNLESLASEFNVIIGLAAVYLTGQSLIDFSDITKKND
jgi:hypothetical protein